MEYQPTIGLEIHIELKTKTKMFCSCKNDPDEKGPNFNICPICLGHPGVLPVINEKSLEQVIKTGLALNCQIPTFSQFDRKNYFYPDLPKGYQISQRYYPLCKDGFLELEDKKIKIREVHLEEDVGRLIHKKDYSLVDFNRAGIPLMELVTEPNLKSAQDAKKFSQELQLILRYLNVSDADMEKGQLRIEANVSMAAKGDKLGTKVEIKNLNSFKAVEKAIEYEIKRQTKILKAGKKVVQETRGWDGLKGNTMSQREKEYAHDYRYFPEPDLPPIKWTEKDIDDIRATLPELPQQRRERFKKEYKLANKQTEVFVFNKELGEYFEKVISELGTNLPEETVSKLIKLTSNYLITDLQGLLSGNIIDDKDFSITPENFAELITLINKGTISSKIAKAILPQMLKTGADPSHIIEEKGLSKITDSTEIKNIIKRVITENQKAVKDFKKGKQGALQFLIGQVMAQSRGRAEPKLVEKLLKKSLS